MLEAPCDYLREKPSLYLDEIVTFLQDEFQTLATTSSITVYQGPFVSILIASKQRRWYIVRIGVSASGLATTTISIKHDLLDKTLYYRGSRSKKVHY
jgi:hypothetical protein